ncbi:hypothetical protein NLJ89_g7418 [Agrocybe chaxingu]|uniref:Uncharacterized protein n=1 Tax=Agrocybe chaxingu TaxID=84603 RepID=A0A9W8MVG8_9AGAR|nr:hypothetical protein NLJ89_g7418 [Agrocybe chaxingu]
MSTIEGVSFFNKLSPIPFSDDELAVLKIVSEERAALPLELRVFIDPSIEPPDAVECKIEESEVDDIRGAIPDSLFLASKEVADNQFNKAKDDDPMEVDMTQRLFLTDEDLRIFSSGSFDEIEALEQQAQEDWKPIADKVQNVGFDCFIKVEHEGEGEMYVANVPEAKAGSMWINARQDASDVPDLGAMTISFNMYSETSGFLSVSRSTWKKVGLWLLPHLVAALVGSLTGYALRRGAAAFGVRVFEKLVRRLGIRWASRVGVFARGVVKFGGGLLAAAAVEAAFWVAWRKYAFTMSVYVFDTQHNWKTTHITLDNAEFPDGKHWEPKDLGRCRAPGATLKAAGLQPKKQIHAGPSIHDYNFGNKIEVFQGVGAGLRFERDDGTQSAAAKFILPRFTDCAVKILPDTPPRWSGCVLQER